MIDLRFGRWENVLLDDFDSTPVACDLVLTDPPFSKRTHDSKPTRYDGSPEEGATPNYDPWGRDEVFHFVRTWHPACRGWLAAITDSDLCPFWREAYADVGRCDFAPVPCILPGMTVRQQGDGPSSEALYLMVARPRGAEWAQWGTRPGWYKANPDRTRKHGRGKPDLLLRAIVADYSLPGDTVVDPMAGWGSTMSAAFGLGRRAIGAEMDREAYETALARFARGVQTDLFAGA